MLEPVEISVEGAIVRGILHEPDTRPYSTSGVVFLAGPATNRAGAHRLNYQLAEALRATGVVSVRFDYRGRGESSGDPAMIGVPTMAQDGMAWRDFLRKRYGMTQFVVVGDCLGCVAGMEVLELADDFSAAIVLGAPHYPERADAPGLRREALAMLNLYMAKLRSIETWRKSFKGQLDFNGIWKAISGSTARKYRTGQAPSLRNNIRGGRTVTFIWGAKDSNASESVFYDRFCKERNWTAKVVVVEDGDKNFDKPEHAAIVANLICSMVVGEPRKSELGR